MHVAPPMHRLGPLAWTQWVNLQSGPDCTGTAQIKVETGIRTPADIAAAEQLPLPQTEPLLAPPAPTPRRPLLLDRTSALGPDQPRTGLRRPKPPEVEMMRGVTVTVLEAKLAVEVAQPKVELVVDDHVHETVRGSSPYHEWNEPFAFPLTPNGLWLLQLNVTDADGSSRMRCICPWSSSPLHIWGFGPLNKSTTYHQSVK